MENLILIGMPGSGKSTLGVLLAKRLGFDFLDTDILIQERQGALLQDILDDLGTEAFLELEGNTLSSLSCRKTVIAPGGSCVCSPAAMEHLKELGTVVYIRLPLSEIERRVTNLDRRGIAFRPGETLADLYHQRCPLYEKYAHLTVDTLGMTMEQSAAAVEALVAQP
jgi:shikimate kinase